MSPTNSFSTFSNGLSLPYAKVKFLKMDEFQAAVTHGVSLGWRMASFFAMDAEKAGMDLVCILADDSNNCLLACKTTVQGNSFPSLTPACPQAHLFEREIWEQYGLMPEGHPWLKPVRFSKPFSSRAKPRGKSVIGSMDFYQIKGEEIHEVGVGPVHAGVIEPGHFRFQCHGENVFHLEISLGYQHRGIEEALLLGPGKGTIHQIETAAGDTTIAHTWAYCQNLETLSNSHVGAADQVVRAIALELERLANHTGDLGALAGDVGFLPTMSYCGRIRGDFLNMTAAICGNRFGRSLLKVGGNRFQLDGSLVEDLNRKLKAVEKDVTNAVELLWESSSVLDRFDDTGTVLKDQAIELGWVGPAARACGVETDVRLNHPFGPYSFMTLPLSVGQKGDVYSRAFVRWLEIKRSIAFVLERLENMPAVITGKMRVPGRPKVNSLAVSLVEGWRGEVCHVVVTNKKGNFRRYKITDPSFHNWSALALALRNQAISDFPLCNKSFNLSYCGHDL